MPKRKALVTDHSWPSLDIEREILARVDAEVVESPSMEETALASVATDADAILSSVAMITRKVLESAPKCLVVARYGVGVDYVDVATATRLGILVTNVPEYCVDEVSEHAMGLLLACARKIPFSDRSVRQGRWHHHVGKPIHRIRGRTLGIIGLGRIGRAVAQKARAFSLRLIAYDPLVPAEAASQLGVELVDLTVLLEQSDFISIHAPLTEATRNLLGAVEFQRMKPSAFVINTARADIVDQEALSAALTKGWIAGAAIDVVPSEPPDPKSPLLHLDNIVVTPHCAYYSEESLVEVREKTALQAAQVLQGQRPRFLVNPEALPYARALRQGQLSG